LLEITKLGEALGAEVGGIDLSQPVPAQTFKQIREAWLEHLVLRFRGQSLSDPQLLAFSRNFGELDPPGPNPLGRPFLADHPEMNVISNITVGGAPIGGLGDGEAIWHADMTYVERPPMAAILYAIEIPAAGGDTYWANMVLAYETLPAGLKAAVHQKLIAGLDLPRQIRRVKPHQLEEAGGIADGNLKQRAAFRQAAQRRLQDAAADRRDLAGVELADRRQARAVLIPSGRVVTGVLNGFDPKRAQLDHPAGPDPLDVAN